MRSPRSLVFLLVAAGTAFLVWGLSSRGSHEAAPDASATGSQVREPSGVPAGQPSGPTCVAGATKAAEGDTALAARVIHSTVAWSSPNASGKQLGHFGLLNVNGVRTVFSVRATQVGSNCRPTWFHVQLPIRPNGITGWVRARDVRTFTVGSQVTVDLSRRRVMVVHDGRTVLDVPAAIGTSATPTPVGHFYVNQRLWAADPGGPWGPGGVGISAFSPVLVNWAQGGPIAIHGTNQPYLLGDAISHGCIRVSNYALLELMKLAPEGTPVVIRA